MKKIFSLIFFFVVLSFSVSAVLPSTDNVSLAYSCDDEDRSGSTMLDLSPYGYDGTIGSSVLFPPGIIGEACRFVAYNDVNNLIDAGSHTETQLASTPSNGNCFGALVKVNNLSDDSGRLYSAGNGNRALYVNLFGGGYWVDRYGSDINCHNGVGYPSAYNCIVSCNGGARRLFWVNGTITSNNTGSSETTSSNTYFGNEGDGSRGLLGDMDEITIFYNQLLSTDEVNSFCDALWDGKGFKSEWGEIIPESYNFNYTNINLINVSQREDWNISNNLSLDINSTDFSMTFLASYLSNWSAVIDNEWNYSKAISENSEYKLSTTETLEHSITALNDSFAEGTHFLCLSGISIYGKEKEGCDIKLNFTYIVSSVVVPPLNDSNITTDDFLSVDSSAFINIYIKFFVLLIWIVFLFFSFKIKGSSGKTIQFFNILQFCFGFVGGTMWWGIHILIGFPIVFVSLGILLGLLMKVKD